MDGLVMVDDVDASDMNALALTADDDTRAARAIDTDDASDDGLQAPDPEYKVDDKIQIVTNGKGCRVADSVVVVSPLTGEVVEVIFARFRDGNVKAFLDRHVGRRV